MSQNEMWTDSHKHSSTGSSESHRDAPLSSDESSYLSNEENNRIKSDFLRFSPSDASASSSEVPPLHSPSHLHRLPPSDPLPWGTPPPPSRDDPLKRSACRTLHGDNGQTLRPQEERSAGNVFQIHPNVKVHTNSSHASGEGGVHESPARPEALPPSQRNHEKEMDQRRTASQDHHYASHHRSHSYHGDSSHHFHRYNAHSSLRSPQREDASYGTPSQPQPPPLSPPPPPSSHLHSRGKPFSTATPPPPPLFRSSLSASSIARSISANGGEASSWKIPPCAPELVIPVPWSEGSSIPFSESLLMDLLAAAVARGGPSVEEDVAKREETNPSFAFLQVEWGDARSIYYRWRLFSLLQGDTLTSWRTAPFQLVAEADAYVWKPPPAILSASDYLLFASRGDTLSALTSSVSWVTCDALEQSTPTTTMGSSSMTTPTNGDVAPTHSLVHPKVDSTPLLRLPVASAWRIAHEIPERYRRMVQLLHEPDAKNWKVEVRLTSHTREEEKNGSRAGWFPAYATVFQTSSSASSSSSASRVPSPAQVSEIALETHWKAWLEKWHAHTFSSSSIGRKMVRGIELADGGAAAEHVLSILLDEVLRVAFENGAFLHQLVQKEKTRESVFTPLVVVEEAAAACTSHCLQLQWYLFLLHDILANAAMKPMRDDEEVERCVKRRKKREEMEAERRKKSTSFPPGIKTEPDTSDATRRNGLYSAGSGALHAEPFSRGEAETPTLIQFPPSPSVERGEHSAVDAVWNGRYQRRLSWSRALEMVLVAWVEATSLVVMNTLYLSGNLKAYPVATDLSEERGFNGPSGSSTCTHPNNGASMVTEGRGMEECTIDSIQAEGDDSRKVKMVFSTAAWCFLHPFSRSANPTAVMTNTSSQWNTNGSLSGVPSPSCSSSSNAPQEKSMGHMLHRQEFFQLGSDEHIVRLSSILERNMLEVGMMLLSWLRFLLLQWREESFKGNTLEKDWMEELEDGEGDFSSYYPSKRPRGRKANEKPLLSLRMYSKMLERYPFLQYESS